MNKNESFSKKFLKSYLSSNFLKIILTFFQFISKLILAKILLPKMFGTFAVALSIIYIFNQICSLGISTHLIREKKECFGNGLMLQLISGIIIIILVLIFNNQFSYINPSLPMILKKFVFVLIPMIIVNQCVAFFNKELLIHKMMLPVIIQNLCYIMISLLLGKFGFEEYSLIYGFMISQIIYAILLWIILKSKLQIEYSFKYSRILFKGSIFLFFISLIGIISNNYYNLILNTMLNAELVGYYTFAVSFCSLLSFFESSSHGVVFPAFVKLKHDKIKVSFLYKYATFLLSVFEILIYFSLICNIDWILPLILDVKKWKPVISILKWLALSSIINPFGIYFMSLMQAYKKDKKMTIYSVSFVIIKIVLAYIMLLNFRTVESIIWSKIFETFLGLIVCFYMISKLIGYKNMIVKEYIYQFILIILFTLLYFFTNHPIARFFGTFFIVLFFMVLFYFITIKPKLPLFIRLLKSK